MFIEYPKVVKSQTAAIKAAWADYTTSLPNKLYFIYYFNSHISFIIIILLYII